jgi:hypothetical protein
MTAFIAYLRVSTDRQGRSGLGLEAQQEAVSRFARSEDTILATFVEVEAGRNTSRDHRAGKMSSARRCLADRKVGSPSPRRRVYSDIDEIGCALHRVRHARSGSVSAPHRGSDRRGGGAQDQRSHQSSSCCCKGSWDSDGRLPRAGTFRPR